MKLPVCNIYKHNKDEIRDHCYVLKMLRLTFVKEGSWYMYINFLFIWPLQLLWQVKYS